MGLHVPNSLAILYLRRVDSRLAVLVDAKPTDGRSQIFLSKRDQQIPGQASRVPVTGLT